MSAIQEQTSDCDYVASWCNYCGRKLEFDRRLGGNFRQCPICKQVVWVPTWLNAQRRTGNFRDWRLFSSLVCAAGIGCLIYVGIVLEKEPVLVWICVSFLSALSLLATVAFHALLDIADYCIFHRASYPFHTNSRSRETPRETNPTEKVVTI